MRSVSLIIFILMLASGVAMADEKAPGSISGTVNYCGLGGLDGMQVYVPGKSFTLITDESGQFHLHGLPAGEYTVSYRKGDKLLNQNRGIQVLAGQDSVLGIIAFCDRRSVAVGNGVIPATAVPVAQIACAAGSADPQCMDADADGVVAAQDCDDSNAKVYPGAVELCDNLDNNCNGSVDENVSALVKNGIGACSAGVVSVMKCAKGFSNCDGDPSNGCEADLMSDDENCGSCGNACAASEMCGLGFC